MTEKTLRSIVVYVAHPRNSPSADVRTYNVLAARQLTRACLEAGFSVISPLQASFGIENALDEKQWLETCLEMLRRCDAVVFPPSWRNSIGCHAEFAFADDEGIIRFFAGVVNGNYVLPGEMIEWAFERIR